MAGSVNKVILIGNLGKDPEVKYFEEGRGVATFSIATTRSYKDKNGERQDQTDWHNIAVWKPGLIGIVEKYLKKGNKVYVEGMLRSRSWEDQNQSTRYITEVIVDSLTLLGSPNENQGVQDNSKSISEPSTSNSKSESVEEDDDLPF